MSQSIDNSRFRSMLKNQPHINDLPQVNKRILAGNWGKNIFIVGSIGMFGYYMITKMAMNYRANGYFEERKSFVFESDPYTQKVRCQYGNIPNSHEFY